MLEVALVSVDVERLELGLGHLEVQVVQLVEQRSEERLDAFLLRLVEQVVDVGADLVEPVLFVEQPQVDQLLDFFGHARD